jgi:hypothetical protein
VKLWVVGEVKENSPSFPDVVWGLVGVFSTREKAEAACRGSRFCVMPIELDNDYGPGASFSHEDYFPQADIQ